MEVQFGLCLRLSKDLPAGTEARSNVSCRDGSALDVVVFEGPRPVLVVEVKSGKGRWSASQFGRYRGLGLPLLLFNEAVGYAEFLETLRGVLAGRPCPGFDQWRDSPLWKRHRALHRGRRDPGCAFCLRPKGLRGRQRLSSPGPGRKKKMTYAEWIAL